MSPSIEIRHLLAVIALAEELNFRRAADRLHITQPALSKQITDLEAEHRFHLFTRNRRRIVELTDAGRVFVQEARSALSHTERAVHLARAAHDGSDSILTIGRPPYANHDWVSTMLAIRLPLYPKLGIRLKTQFAMESVHSVLVGEVDLALVTAPPQDVQITAVSFAPAPLYAVLPQNHPAAHKERLVLQDLAKDEWILFPKRFDPIVFEAIMDAAQCGSQRLPPKQVKLPYNPKVGGPNPPPTTTILFSIAYSIDRWVFFDPVHSRSAPRESKTFAGRNHH